MLPVVSIIIPVHNREILLPITLRSVLGQTFQNWECIIVDDHSTDNTNNVVKLWERMDPRFISVSLPDPLRYVNAARNYGLLLAKGNYVNFLDSDDILLPKKLQRLMTEFDINPSLDMVACRHIDFNNEDLSIQPQLKYAEQLFWLDATWDCPKLGFLWNTMGPIWRIESIKAIGMWNENIRAFEDPELNVRAILNNLKIKRIEEILCLYARKSSGSITSLPKNIFYRMLIDGMKSTWDILELHNQITKYREQILGRRLYRITRNLPGVGQRLSFWNDQKRNFKLSLNTYMNGLFYIFLSFFSEYQSNQLSEKFFPNPKIKYFSDDVNFDSLEAKKILNDYYAM